MPGTIEAVSRDLRKLLKEKDGSYESRSYNDKRNKTLSFIDKQVIEIPPVPLEMVIEDACIIYNQHQIAKQSQSFVEVTPSSDLEFLYRITVNYIKHRLTHYERLVNKIYGQPGFYAAYRLLNVNVYDAISKAYPALKEACEKQLLRKLGERGLLYSQEELNNSIDE